MPEFININNFDKIDNSVISFGNFDGFHLGHQNLISSLIDNAIKYNSKSILIIFKPHTKKIIINDDNFKEISPYDIKIKLLSSTKLDFVVTVDFSEDFSNISAEDFVYLINKKFNPLLILIGYDNKFGYKGMGSFDFLRKMIKKNNWTIELTEFKPFALQSNIIKSSVIKNYIADGNIENANIYLGRNYEISGTIVEGKQIGNNLGFPTANLKIDFSEQILPMHGVYYVNLTFENISYKGLCNIGYRPTFNDNVNRISIETHLKINNDINLYGKKVIIKFLRFIRKEIQFKNKDELIKQIKEDIQLI